MNLEVVPVALPYVSGPDSSFSAALIREDSMPEVEIVRILGVIHPELDSL